MDTSDPLESRNLRLHNLRTTDPVAWALCNGYRGPSTIAKLLNKTRDQVQTDLDRLVKAKEVKATKYYRGYSYRPHSQELKRLARRAWKLRQENGK